jgi:transposase-like protein
MGAPYSKEFKQAAIKKILGRGDQTLDAACKEIGISQAAGSAWLRESGKIAGMNPSSKKPASQGKRAQDYSPEDKLEAVMEFRRRQDQPEAQGEFLRSQGLFAATIEAWAKDMLGALGKPARQPKRTPEEMAKDKQIAELQRDLRRKEKALAETTALLVLKKKAESIWGLVDDEESA